MYSNIVLIMHNTTRHLEMSHTKIYFFQANVATRHDILVNLFEAKVARNVATSTLRARPVAPDLEWYWLSLDSSNGYPTVQHTVIPSGYPRYTIAIS